MKKELRKSKTISSRKISKKILHSLTIIKCVRYCRIKLLSKINQENAIRDVVTQEDIIVKERIKENEKLFSVEELKIVNENFNVVTKVYLLGLIDKKELK